jgi:hypothetical protein
MTLVADFNPAVAVTFQRMRALLLEGGGGLQEGVLGAGDLKVSQRAAGANLSADVAAGAAWVTIDTGARNGATHIYNDAVFNAGPFTAGHATLPRVDQVILRYNDSAIPTGAGNTPTIEVLTGTATSGATLDNRLGATALPNDCLRLADILVPAASTSVTTANIRDRRPWARGGHVFQIGSGGGNVTTASGSFVTLGAGLLDVRMECTGVPLEIIFSGTASNLTGGQGVILGIIDVTSGSIEQARQEILTPTGGGQCPFCVRAVLVPPAAGSRIYSPRFAVTSAGTAQVFNGSVAIAPRFSVRELVLQNAFNN